MAKDKLDNITEELFEETLHSDNITMYLNKCKSQSQMLKVAEAPNRVVVVYKDRVIDQYNVNVTLSYQDNGNTLKMFVEDK